jgi:hypothetical protein
MRHLNGWDITLIEAPTDGADLFRLSDASGAAVENAMALGFEASTLPFRTQPAWPGLAVSNLNRRASRAARLHELTFCPVTVNSADVKITDRPAFHGKTSGVVGMSGGPLINREDGGVIGVNSFGLPQDQHEKTSLGAVDLRAALAALS